MRFRRSHGWLLIGVAVWNVFIWLTFAKNLSAAHASGESRPAGYWVAHTVLIVVDLAIAAVLGTVGVRALRAMRTPDQAGAGQDGADEGAARR